MNNKVITDIDRSDKKGPVTSDIGRSIINQ